MVSKALEYLKSLNGYDANVISEQAQKYDWEFTISFEQALTTPIFAFHIAKYQSIKNNNLPVDDVLKDLMLAEITTKTRVRGLWHGILNQPIKTVDIKKVEESISEAQITALLNTM